MSTIDIVRAADCRYADVTGDDGAPEIAVGRRLAHSRYSARHSHLSSPP